MKGLGHGANVAEMARQYKKCEADIIDFSSNINPFMSEALKDRLPQVLEAARNYPDSHYTALREKIACYLKCGKDQVIVGNGATEIMYLLIKSLGPISLGIVHPTFSEYERSAQLNQMPVVDLYLTLDDEKEQVFTLSEEVVKERLEQIEALFVCNPNNPTGKVQDLKWLVELMKAADKWLIVDETFMEFVEQDERYSLISEVVNYRKLIVIKAITKFYGLPGLRLGYGVTSHEGLLEIMYHYKEPWTVNSFAEQLTGILLEDEAYQLRSKAYFKAERSRVLEALKSIPNLRVYHTDTNFILLKLEKGKAHELKEALFLKENLLIRDASNFKGLDEQFIRVAIKAPEENNQLIKALHKILSQKE